MATINASKLEFGFHIQGWSDVIRHNNILTNKLFFVASIKGSFYSDRPLPRNPALDLFYDCNDEDRFGNSLQGRLSFNFENFGECANHWIEAGKLNFNFSIHGEDVLGKVLLNNKLEFDFKISAAGIHVSISKASWLKWSQIGHLSFTQDHSNIAGERPLYSIGIIYDIIKLEKSVIVYGSKGIVQVKPIEKNWSPKQIISIGSKNKKAQIGTELNHWYVDLFGCLWHITEKEQINLGYEEYLNPLTTAILSLDKKNNLLYICSSTIGYVYSIKDKSLCKGIPNISGFAYDKKATMVVSDQTLIIPPISFTTDIYDLGTRKEKTIFNIELATEGIEDMEVCIAYRMDKRIAFAYTPWVTFTPQGIAYLPCYCREFKLCFRMTAYEKVYLDELKINGVIHGFSHLDIKRR